MNSQRGTVALLFVMKGAVCEVENRVDDIGVINVIGGNTGCVRSPCWLPVCDMPTEIIRLQVQQKQLAFFEILIPQSRNNIFPMRMFGIFRWILRIKRIVAIPARHSNQIRRLDVLWILKIFLQRPLRFVEVWIRKLAQPHDSRWLTRDIRDTFTGAFVEPESVFIRSSCLRAARFCNYSE